MSRCKDKKTLHDVVDIARITGQNSSKSQKARESKAKEKRDDKAKNKKPNASQEEGRAQGGRDQKR